MDELHASIVICTRNRAAMLQRLLESICALQVPTGTRWEVLVVDNASSDATPEILRSFADRLPLRSTVEPRAGASHARNRGIDEARGRYICWTDDDVLVGPGWFAAYLEAFERHPEAAVFGGAVDPLLEPPERPSFARRKDCWPLAGAYAHRDPGDAIAPLALAGMNIPYGANFAVRTAEQRRFLYDVELGPSPSFSRMADDVDAVYRMMRAGATGWWVPGTRVRHVIPANRQTMGYVFAYYRRLGKTVAWLRDHHPGANINEVGGPPPFVLPRSVSRWPAHLAGVTRKIVQRLGFSGAGWLGWLAMAGYAVGLIAHKWDGDRRGTITANLQRREA